MEHFVLAVTTYNRIDFLKDCIQSWEETKSNKFDWSLVVADDGSWDGTKDYLLTLDAHIIWNRNRGVAHQTNTILKEIDESGFSVCFKCDDDIIFSKPGWDTKYWEAIQESGYDHICYDNPEFNIGDWCKDGVFEPPILEGDFIARVKSQYVKGCFYTVTQRIIDEVGYLDSEVFFHGCEHTDYTTRCCRAGFNVLAHPFDIIDSNEYIKYRFPWAANQCSISQDEYQLNSNTQQEHQKKLELIKEDRGYIPYMDCSRRMIRSRKEIKIL